MASQYTAELPAIPIDPTIPKFFENFYHISDTPHAHERYADSFTDDATMILASRKAVGREGLSLHSLLYHQTSRLPSSPCSPAFVSHNTLIAMSTSIPPPHYPSQQPPFTIPYHTSPPFPFPLIPSPTPLAPQTLHLPTPQPSLPPPLPQKSSPSATACGRPSPPAPTAPPRSSPSAPTAPSS